MKLTKKIKKAIDAHVLEVYPAEAVGVIVDREYHKLTNTSDTPDVHFKVGNKEFLEVIGEGDVKALIHSHTFDTPVDQRTSRRSIDRRTPSKTDMVTQQAMAIPFGIVHTDGETVSDCVWLGWETQPLLEREFIHGITDCYSIIRDWYKTERNVDLPDYPREWAWWETDVNMYADLFEDAGFAEIDPKDIEIGDVVLMSVLTEDTINHAAVYTDNNKITHHLVGRLSTQEPYNKWFGHVKKVVRYIK